MHAQLEILKPLVSSISRSTWLNTSHFPFVNFTHLQPRIYDMCSFYESTHGSLGIVFIQFDPDPSILVLPYHLSRNNTGPSLARMHPWSLSDASHDSRFYWAWRRALHRQNSISTLRGGLLEQRYIKGEPETTCCPITSSSVDTEISLVHKEVLKIRKALNDFAHNSFEYQVMEFLMGQASFTSHPELISLHTYTFQNKKYPLAMATRHLEYIGFQENPNLYSTFVFTEAQAPKHPLIESIARATAEYHLAMAKAKSPSLSPEPLKGSVLTRWANGCAERINELLTTLQKLDRNHSFHSLHDFNLSAWIKCLNYIVEQPHLGLLIRTHSRLRIHSFGFLNNNIIIRDFCSPLNADFFLKEKQSALFDVAEILVSLKVLFTVGKRQNSSTFMTIKHLYLGHKFNSKSDFSVYDEFLKVYTSVLNEDIHASELSPKEAQGELAMLTLYILISCLRRFLETPLELNSPDIEAISQIAQEALKNMRVY